MQHEIILILDFRCQCTRLIARRVVNDIAGINRLVSDLTSSPPATFEREWACGPALMAGASVEW